MTDRHEDEVVAHWSAEARAYPQRHRGWRRYLHLELSQRKRYALDFVLTGIRDARSLLDVGCGTGDFLRELEPYVPELWGIDPSAEMVSIARRQVPQARILHGYLDAFSDQAEVVTALGVVGLIDDLDAFFEQANRALVQNGYLLFSYIHRDSLFSYCEMGYNTLKKRFFPDRSQSRFRRYSSAHIAVALRRSGFELLKRKTFGFYSNAFKVGPLKYVYAPVEALLDVVLAWEFLRYPVGINHLVLARKVGSASSARTAHAADSTGVSAR